MPNPRTCRNTGLLSMLAAILAGEGAPSLGDLSFLGRGAGTRRRGENKQPPKPQWLQDRLIVRAAEKRARKAALRLAGGTK